jgi:hypothetical protein
MDKMCLTCLRIESKIDPIPLCDKLLRASRRNNFGLAEETQALNRNVVRDRPAFLARAGFQISRLDTCQSTDAEHVRGTERLV